MQGHCHVGARSATKWVSERQLWLEKHTAEGLRRAATSPTALLSGRTKRSFVGRSLLPSATMIAAPFCIYTLCRPFLSVSPTSTCISHT
jgi:hypothetical protein